MRECEQLPCVQTLADKKQHDVYVSCSTVG